MPCPYFEPQRVAAHPEHTNARLPLIDEYEGLCHARVEPVAAPAALRFQSCNHGYSRGCCEFFPLDDTRSCLRYSVIASTATALDLICIEEEAYAPVRWHSVHYVLETGDLEPDPGEVPMRAQALAFCRSYLARFSH